MKDQEIRDLSEILELYEDLSAREKHSQDEQDNLDMFKKRQELKKSLGLKKNERIKGRRPRMIKRTCPLCGHPWYSAVEQDPWNCQNCGFLLTPDMNENPEERDAENQHDGVPQSFL